MTAHTFTLAYEEIPLRRGPGVVGLLVNGEAEITVFGEGEWHITAIFVDGKRDDDNAPYLKPVLQLDENDEAYRTIAAELETGWKKVIEDRVQDFIGEYA